MLRCKVAGFLIFTILFLEITSLLLVTEVNGNRDQKLNHPAQTFETGTILFDESHTANGSSMFSPSNTSFFGALLAEYGFNSTTNFDQPLTAALLSPFDILVIFFPMLALSENEVSAVHDFVSDGGHLLLVGLEGVVSGWGFHSSNLNPLSQPYGVTFNLNRRSAIIENLGAHPINYDVISIHTNCDDFRGCTLTVESPATTVVEHNSESIVAITETGGGGRVVFSGTAAPFLMYRLVTNWQIESDDLHQFSLNVIDWLMGNPSRKVTIPDKFVITCGNGPNLTPEEVANYKMFVGMYHDHTTDSDGQDSAADMLYKGISIGLDWMLLTDHSYETLPSSGLGGISGALKTKALVKKYNLDCPQFVGAELSRGMHTVGFPLTENILTDNQTEMVEGIHAQGAIAILCHPTISYSYAEVYEAYDEYGYDAIELDSDGWIYGGLEDGYFKNFLGGSDTHNKNKLGSVLNVAFVENPTGPNGTISDQDLVEATLNRRIVILNPKQHSMVYGQKVWVNRYLEITQIAEEAIETARETLESATGVGLSKLYLHEAEVALSYWSSARALRMAQAAISETALGIDIDKSSPSNFALPNDSSFILQLNITDSLNYDISLNTSVFRSSAVTSGVVNKIANIPSGSFALLDRVYTTIEKGYTEFAINFHNLNTTSSLPTVTLRYGGIIDNLDVISDVNEIGTNVTIRINTNRPDTEYISSAILHYDIGDGQVDVSMMVKALEVLTILELLPGGVLMNYSIDISDTLGETYTFGDRSYSIPGEGPGLPTTTTTTTTITTTTTTPSETTSTATTTSTTPTDGNNWMIIMVSISVLAVVGVVIIIIVVLKRR